MTNASADDLSLFKSVPGGFVYRARHPWLFGPGTHYFVTAQQRDAILAETMEPTVMRATVSMLLLIAVALGVSLPFIWYRHGYQFDPLSMSDLAIIMVATLVAMLVAIKITLSPLIKRLEPLLATLPRSDQKISLIEYNRSLIKESTPAQLRNRAQLFFVLGAISWLNVVIPHRFAAGFGTGEVIWTMELVAAIVLSAIGAYHWWRAKQKTEQTGT